MSFDPDAYLAEKQTSFDPDSYLNEYFHPKPASSTLWNALSIPEKMSREGLNEIANIVPSIEPTGNTFRDIALNTPKIASETLAEIAPSFISPQALLTEGAFRAAGTIKPIVGKLGKFIGEQAEKLSGLSYKNPGILKEAFEDPSLIVGKNLEQAREAYKSAKAITEESQLGNEQIRQEMQAPLSHEEFVNKALEHVKDGTITADEALEARKSVDALKRKLTQVGYYKTREIFDNIAKEKFSNADLQYKNAIKSEALRNIFPTNKGGTPSIFKTAIGGAMLPGVAPLMSPAVQGTIASGLGLASKAINPLLDNPVIGTVAGATYNALANKSSSDKIKNILNSDPQSLGKYSNILQQSSNDSSKFSLTHWLLMNKDPEYNELVHNLNEQ